MAYVLQYTLADVFPAPCSLVQQNTCCMDGKGQRLHAFSRVREVESCQRHYFDNDGDGGSCNLLSKQLLLLLEHWLSFEPLITPCPTPRLPANTVSILLA